MKKTWIHKVSWSRCRGGPWSNDKRPQTTKGYRAPRFTLSMLHPVATQY